MKFLQWCRYPLVLVLLWTVGLTFAENAQPGMQSALAAAPIDKVTVHSQPASRVLASPCGSNRIYLPLITAGGGAGNSNNHPTYTAARPIAFARTSDFNCDGYDDLAVGAPGKDTLTVEDAGAVKIINGTASGLSIEGTRRLIQGEELAGRAEVNDRLGSALTTGDFNGDTYADLATSAWYEDVEGVSNAGAVNVIYGTRDGLSSFGGDQIWHQNSAGIDGVAEEDDKFGFQLSSGDFNGDGYADLVVGVEQEDVGSLTDAGSVHVIYGSATKLTATGDQLWTQESAGIDGGAEAGDKFGSALASGDFNGDGYSDLAIGVEGESVDSIADAGAVNVIYGSSTGLTATGNQIWHQDSSGIAGVAEEDNRFGNTLAGGDFNGDGYADLAIGVTGEDIDGKRLVGAVNVIFGSASGLRAAGDEIWENDIGVNAGDFFGWSLASGNFNGDEYTDLAIGAPFAESLFGVVNAGMVRILLGSADGLYGGPNILPCDIMDGVLGQGSNTVDEAEENDLWGYTLSSGDYDGDGYGDLAVGTPAEALGLYQGAGAVNVFYGHASCTFGTEQFWNENSGIGELTEGDAFGSSMP